MSPEASFEMASSRASSDSNQAASQGLRASALRLGPSRQGPRASWQGLGDVRGRADGGSNSGSDLDISCLVDNTPFRINEVCPIGLALEYLMYLICC